MEDKVRIKNLKSLLAFFEKFGRARSHSDLLSSYTSYMYEYELWMDGWTSVRQCVSVSVCVALN